MKIVDAQPNISRKYLIQCALESLICMPKKAVLFESESDLRRFRKLAAARGLKVKAQKQARGGWLVWLKNI